MSNILTVQNNEWVRDFPGEKIGALEKLLFASRGGKVAHAAKFGATFFESQAEFVDTNFYYRLGGVDLVKAKTYNDILAIQWGIGSWQAETYLEQVSIAKNEDINYVSWIILDPASSMTVVEQIDNMAKTPGVLDAPIFIDEEPPRTGVRYINYAELKSAVGRIEEISPFAPGCYSRVNIFEAVFGTTFPDWFGGVNQWIAQYLYMPGTTALYSYYDDFLKTWAWSYPPAVIKSKLYADPFWRDAVCAWQISPKGRALQYIAPLTLPNGDPAIKSCDLNVSMMPVYEFVLRLFYRGVPIPEESYQEQIDALKIEINRIDGEIDFLESYCTSLALTCYGHTAKITGLETRVTALENEEPVPDNGSVVALVIANAPAFSYRLSNDKGKPIMDVNVYQETGDPKLKWVVNNRLWVMPTPTVADGGTLWHEITAVVTDSGAEPVDKHGFPALYIRKDKIDV